MKNFNIILIIILWVLLDTNVLLSGIPLFLIPIQKLNFIQEQRLNMAIFFTPWDKTSIQDQMKSAVVNSKMITTVYTLGFLNGGVRRLEEENDGGYFLTSGRKEFERNFGKVFSQKMIINSFGEIVLEQWSWLGKRFPLSIQHTFVIMPDQERGITEIKRNLFADQPLEELVGAIKMNSSKPIRLLAGAMHQSQVA